jgi:hypothetical protein
MNITLTNLDDVAVPFSTQQDKGFSMTLEPGEPKQFNETQVTVASVGDNPTWREEIEQGFKALFALLAVWHQRKGIAPPHRVVVEIENHGPNALRILLGSNVDEVQLAADDSYTAAGPEYIEIRELGV